MMRSFLRSIAVAAWPDETKNEHGYVPLVEADAWITARGRPACSEIRIYSETPLVLEIYSSPELGAVRGTRFHAPGFFCETCLI